MIAAIVVTLAATLGAASLSYLYDEEAPLAVRLAGGVAVGTTLLGFLGYVFAATFGTLTPGLVWLAAALLLTPLSVFRHEGPSAALRRDLERLGRLRLCSPGRRTLRLAFVPVAVLLWVLFRGVVSERPDGIYTLDHHNLGDLPWHCAIVQGFAVGHNYPPQHVEFAGTRLTYPFLVDFITAEYVACGATLAQAFTLQNLTLALALLVLLHRWAFQVTRSAYAAAATPAIVLLSGGWGWMTAVSQWRESGQSLGQFLLHLPRDYTLGDGGWKWANSLTTLFLTQRGLLLAVPLALIVLGLFWQARTRPKGKTRRLIWAGAVAGLLPLVHGHTILSLMLIASGLALPDVWEERRRWRGWAGYFVMATVLVLPQARALAEKTGVRAGAFVGWQPGWEAPGVGINPLFFWYRNTGPLLAILAVTLIWRFANGRRLVPRRLALYYVSFLLCFVVPNLFRLAPWAWDNMKVFLYWFLGTAAVVAVGLAALRRHGGVIGRVFAAVLLVLLTLSGGLDVWRIASGQSEQRVFERDGIVFADALRAATTSDAVILHAPAYNHPALLAGRHLLAGYHGHLWSHGLDFTARVEDVKRIYSGAPDAPALLEKWKVRYVIVGPAERMSQDIKLNEAFFTRYPVVTESGGYRVYRIE